MTSSMILSVSQDCLAAVGALEEFSGPTSLSPQQVLGTDGPYPLCVFLGPGRRRDAEDLSLWPPSSQVREACREWHHMGLPHAHFQHKQSGGQGVVHWVGVQFFEVGLFLGRHSGSKQPRP